MTLRFLVDSFQSNPSSTLSLEVLENGISKYNIPQCTEKGMIFDFKRINENSIIDFIVSRKNPKETIVKDGKVISDTFLKITNIFINHHDVIGKINLFSNYFTEKNGVLRTNGHMNFNGRYCLKFRYPLSNHILYCSYYKPKF
jgi:hypothetical protein